MDGDRYQTSLCETLEGLPVIMFFFAGVITCGQAFDAMKEYTLQMAAAAVLCKRLKVMAMFYVLWLDVLSMHQLRCIWVALVHVISELLE